MNLYSKKYINIFKFKFNYNQIKKKFTNQLAKHIRERVPGVALSSDFISGFCGETEEQHRETLSLMREVGFEQAFMFAYSLREKTAAHRRYNDDVPGISIIILFFVFLHKLNEINSF